MKPTSNPIPTRLLQWAVVSNPDASPFDAPELATQHLTGDCHNHPRFDNGKNITTSRIVGKNGSDHIVTKSGSVYQIGEPKTSYLAKFPDARRRLLDSLPLV